MSVRLQRHPTHHSGYKPSRLIVGAVVGVLGVLGCAVVIGLPADSGLLRVLKGATLLIGVLAFCGGVALCLVTELQHYWTRCPQCKGRIRRSRIDFEQTYYPCRACAITWTCECRKATD